MNKRIVYFIAVFFAMIVAFGGGYKCKKNNDLKLMQSHSFDFPAENNGWIKVGHKPVFGNKVTKSVFDPFVYVENDLLNMVVSERKTFGIIKVVSEDGENWSPPVVLLEPVKNTWEHFVNRASVVKRDGIYYMWYTGQSPSVSKIGLATSRDGVNYMRYSGNPVLVPTKDAEGVSVMNPHVLWNEGKGIWQMWYAAGENYEPDVIFYAESIDGINWNKSKKAVLTRNDSHLWETSKIGGCYVKLLTDGTYEMYYIGYQNVHVARICYATSKDGINWERKEDNLLLSPSRNSWDSDAVYKPSIVQFKNKTMMFYNGRKAGEEYIGLALKE